MMTNTCSFKRNVQEEEKMFPRFKMLLLTISLYCTSQHNDILLDFGECIALEFEPDKLVSSEFMLKRMLIFKIFRSPGIIQLGQHIDKKNFELLEKVINREEMKIDISLTQALNKKLLLSHFLHLRVISIIFQKFISSHFFIKRRTYSSR